jgi:hypothetical protein
MADISISINPAETISANISPPNSISIGPSTSYPPHAPSHAPGAYDSLSSYYAVTGDLTGYVNKNQTGYLSGTFYPYSANPAGYVQGAVVRPSNTGNFVDKSSAVLLTGNQNASGLKNFYSRPTFNSVGLQTTGEYEEFNLWNEFSGALYPYPKNALNRSYNILRHAEYNSGPSGATIWYNIPQWTGEKPVGTGVSSFYNTGFWARDYDWSCVSFEGARTVGGGPSLPITLISARHALGVKHAQATLGSKVAFVSNVETGYTWEATVASSYTLSGDAVLYTFTQDAPSQIRPASIIGSSPTPSWRTNSLTQTRVLTVKDSTVLADFLTSISTGFGFQAGSLIVGHAPDGGARYTGAHMGGDSSSPVFLPLDDGRLVYIGGASTVNTVAFVGDPAIRSGINFATSGYSIDTYNVPNIQVSSLLPTTGQINQIGTETNKWYEINSTFVKASVLQGDLREWDTLIYNEYIYGETINITQNDLNGITINVAQPDLNNTINFSGTYSDTFWARFVIPNSGSSINFSSSGPTLLMPNGSGFSGIGYVIEARAVESNKILIHPISFPSGTYISSTGYLTGYVNKSETGSFITTSQTGQFVSTGSTGQFVTGSVVRPSQTGAFLTTGAADNRYALQSATGDFATNSSVVSLTGNQDVSGVKNFYSRPTVDGTGVLLSGEASTTSASTSISLISSIWS